MATTATMPKTQGSQVAGARTACVIGAGPGGYVCAIRLAQLGVKTTLVEKLPTLGGVCLNWGCIPSKAFITSARVWEEIQHLGDIGISVEKPTHDMARMKAWKDSVVKRLTGGIAELMKRHKVDTVHGSARFTGPGQIEVALADGGARTIEADAFVVATGSRSIEIPGFPVDQQNILTSRGVLDLTEVPDHLLVIGGGVIGLEIGQYMMKFGAQLTVVEMMDQILPGTDPECVRFVSRRLKKGKAKVHLKTKAKGATVANGRVSVALETPKGEVSVEADKVLVSVGRRPNTEELGLDAAGVPTDARGFIEVDGQMRTKNPRVYAIGDVAGGMLLAHKASREGLVAAGVIAGGTDVMDSVIPAAIFSDPEIGAVGLTEADAKAKGIEVKVGTFPFAASGRALAGRETDGMVKVVADARDDRVLGVAICGPHASELIAEATLAIEAGLTAEDLALTVHTHPTLSEAVMEAAEDVHRMAVHIYNPPK